MITYDDAYEPTKTMAMTRKLVEEDNVLLALGTIGTNTNAAIQPYLNSKKVPHLPCRGQRPGTSRRSFPGP
jgi:ABC-type branched-subunit amino acid transport system substrate-binding protein